MMTYVPEIKTIFTCDVFGAHYSHPGVFNDTVASEADYMKAFQYYYDCIFGPYKPSVAAAAAAVVFALSCSLFDHNPEKRTLALPTRFPHPHRSTHTPGTSRCTVDLCCSRFGSSKPASIFPAQLRHQGLCPA